MSASSVSAASLNGPVGQCLHEHLSQFWDDIVSRGGTATPSKGAPGWAFLALTIPYAALAWLVVQRICHCVGMRAGIAAGYPAKRSHNIGDAFRETVGMSITTYITYCLLAKQSWVWDLSTWTYAVVEGPTFDHPNVPADVGVPKSYMTFYPIEFGWYFGLMICMLTEYPRKSDFHIMFTHHIVTTFLLALSGVTGHTRIGIIVVILHDSSDILLNGSKLLHYLLEETPLHILCDMLFAIFAVVFFITRLVLFPYLLWCTFQSMQMIGFQITTPEFLLLMALVVLVFFHAYWFLLVIKILKEALIGGEVQGDVRDEDEVDYERRTALGVVGEEKKDD